MKNSCVKHPTESKFTKIYDWQLIATEKSKEASALLSLFEYYHNIRVANNEQIISRNKILRDEDQQTVDLYQYHTYEQIIERTQGMIKNKTAVSKSIKILTGLGFVSKHKNPNKKYKFDQTTYYLFHPEIVNNWIYENIEKNTSNDTENHIVQNQTIENDDINHAWSKNGLSMEQKQTMYGMDLDRQEKRLTNRYNKREEEEEEIFSFDEFKKQIENGLKAKTMLVDIEKLKNQYENRKGSINQKFIDIAISKFAYLYELNETTVKQVARCDSDTNALKTCNDTKSEIKAVRSENNPFNLKGGTLENYFTCLKALRKNKKGVETPQYIEKFNKKLKACAGDVAKEINIHLKEFTEYNRVNLIGYVNN